MPIGTKVFPLPPLRMVWVRICFTVFTSGASHTFIIGFGTLRMECVEMKLSDLSSFGKRVFNELSYYYFKSYSCTLMAPASSTRIRLD